MFQVAPLITKLSSHNERITDVTRHIESAILAESNSRESGMADIKHVLKQLETSQTEGKPLPIVVLIRLPNRWVPGCKTLNDKIKKNSLDDRLLRPGK